jgi:hypothetical protein
MLAHGYRLRKPAHPALAEAVTAAGTSILNELAVADGSATKGLDFVYIMGRACNAAAVECRHLLPEIFETFGGETWSTEIACCVLSAYIADRLWQLLDALIDVDSAQEHAAIRRQWFAGQLRDGPSPT